MKLRRTNIAIYGYPLARIGQVVGIGQPIETTVVRLQQITVGVKSHPPRVRMRRGSMRSVAVNTLPRGSWEQRSITTKGVTGEVAATIWVGHVLMVARDEDDV